MKKICIFLMLASWMIGCSSAQKARLDTRDKIVQQSGLFCDFVNEADYKDVDIELNLRMGNKCNGVKPFSISGYKKFNESQGFMFCCSVKDSIMENNSSKKHEDEDSVTEDKAPAKDVKDTKKEINKK